MFIVLTGRYFTFQTMDTKDHYIAWMIVTNVTMLSGEHMLAYYLLWQIFL